jgi:hypothetical protein
MARPSGAGPCPALALPSQGTGVCTFLGETLVGQTIAFGGLSSRRDRVEKPTLTKPLNKREPEKAKIGQGSHPRPLVFFMKFRGPKALGNRRQKAIVLSYFCL